MNIQILLLSAQNCNGQRVHEQFGPLQDVDDEIQSEWTYIMLNSSAPYFQTTTGKFENERSCACNGVVSPQMDEI